LKDELPVSPSFAHESSVLFISSLPPITMDSAYFSSLPVRGWWDLPW